jgi:hypothetical protein
MPAAVRAFVFVAQLAALGTTPVPHVSAANRDESPTIAEGLKSPAFRDAYRRAFAPYLGLQWVSKPVLEEPSRSATLPDGTKVRVFVTCRPHACASERLSFAFEPASGRRWGSIRINSETDAQSSSDALNELLDNALERKP